MDKRTNKGTDKKRSVIIDSKIKNDKCMDKRTVLTNEWIRRKG